MAVRIICNVIMFLNLAVATSLLIYEFIKFTDWLKNIDASKFIIGEKRTRYIFNSYGLKMLKIIASMIIPVAISIITCLLDGLTDERYIGIPFVIVVIGILPLTVLFSLRFYFSRRKCGIELPKGQMSGAEPSFALFVSFAYLIVLAQAVYTIVLLCAL